MSPVDWHDDALNDLILHDLWRVQNGWERIGAEIMAGVEKAFAKGVFPWRQARISGESIPVYRTRVTVRSKPFLVYFVEKGTGAVIRRVLHPRQDVSGVEGVGFPAR